MPLGHARMPKPVPMPSGFLNAAINYSHSAMSLNDLKKEFGVSLITVKKWMLSIGVTEKPKRTVISAKKIGKPSHRKGTKCSEETLKKMRTNAKVWMPTTKGFKFTDESKDKMRRAAQRRMATTNSLQKMQEGRIKNRLKDDERLARAKARNACKRMLQRILTMSRTKKDGRRSELLLGYTKQDLRAHIETQFKSGMGWSERGSFHIDHIKPVAQFFREGVYDPILINALSNLQVLTPEENRKKGDSWTHVSIPLEGVKPRKTALIIDKLGVKPYA